MNQMEAPVSALERVQAFVADYRAAPNDADIEIRIGMTEDGSGAVIIDVGKKRHALTSGEARKLARIFEDAMNEAPTDPEAEAIPNMVLALRAGADKADQAVTRQQS